MRTATAAKRPPTPTTSRPERAMRPRLPPRRTVGRLPFYLALVCALLIALVCLNPLTGWRDLGLGPLSFLLAPPPRDRSLLDLVLNLAGFMPLGFLAAAALLARHRPRHAWLLATLICALLSLAVETLQNYLPTRVASNVDLLTNTVGGAFGAALALRWGRVFEEGGVLWRWRHRRVLGGHIGELGLILIGLWWLSLLQPTALLFAAGDLRPLLDLPAPLAFSARRYMTLETLVVASQTVAVLLLLRRLMLRPSFLLALLVLLAGVGLRALSCVVFIVPPDALLWLTPAGLQGAALGLLLGGLGWRLPGWLQHLAASLALLLTTALVNMAPDNPFLEMALRMPRESHAINFSGLTRLLASLWPMLALVYLTARQALLRDEVSR